MEAGAAWEELFEQIPRDGKWTSWNENRGDRTAYPARAAPVKMAPPGRTQSKIAKRVARLPPTACTTIIFIFLHMYSG